MAVQLPPDQRLTLACRSRIDAAWEAEMGRRIARYDDGGVKSIPAGETRERPKG